MGTWENMNLSMHWSLEARVKFWKDIWCGDKPLCVSFPSLFALAVFKDAWVKDVWRKRIQLAVDDRVIWRETKCGKFSVKSLYKSLVSGHPASFPSSAIWKVSVQPRVSSFGWEATWGKALTLDQLQKRGWAVVNRCYLCQRHKESIDHIFLYCEKARTLWALFYSMFGLQWVLLALLRRCFWGGMGLLWEEKEGCLESKSFVSLWTVWKARNKVALRKKSCQFKGLSFLWSETKLSIKDGPSTLVDFVGWVGGNPLRVWVGLLLWPWRSARDSGPRPPSVGKGFVQKVKGRVQEFCDRQTRIRWNAGICNGPEFSLRLKGGRCLLLCRWWWVLLVLLYSCGGRFPFGGVRCSPCGVAELRGKELRVSLRNTLPFAKGKERVAADMMGVGGVGEDNLFSSGNGLKVGGLVVEGLALPLDPRPGKGDEMGFFLPLGSNLWFSPEKFAEISALTTRQLHWYTGIAQILGVADGRHGDAVPKDEGGICTVTKGFEREGRYSLEQALGVLEVGADVVKGPLSMVFKDGSAVVFPDNFNPFQERGAVLRGSGVSASSFEGSDSGLVGEDLSLEKGFSKLTDFSRFLGMPVEGFEEETWLKLRKLRKKVGGGNPSKG
ncbi:hypothetical protein CK203_068938 [Vitis vinifera]|uniref:Reverse transcriptase zinc-binding domain-containing protein n=1 Tax=Vitis vinifera TaxID=29760 RepID=A0A438F0Q1_VITVI|nr:hypothetical protein CK203_068938 [Vitis vinifera]